MAEIAEATGQDIYSLCLCLERYPNVYMALRQRLIRRALEAANKDGFASRRERTRQERIGRLTR